MLLPAARSLKSICRQTSASFHLGPSSGTIRVHDRSEERIKTFTNRGVECLQELHANIRTWEGGMGELLHHEQGDPKVIESIMADERSY